MQGYKYRPNRSTILQVCLLWRKLLDVQGQNWKLRNYCCRIFPIAYPQGAFSSPRNTCLFEQFTEYYGTCSLGVHHECEKTCIKYVELVGTDFMGLAHYSPRENMAPHYGIFTPTPPPIMVYLPPPPHYGFWCFYMVGGGGGIPLS